MLNISSWTETFLQALEDIFGSRVWFVGLQGSYGRGEATETSDIDMVVILDNLSPADIHDYNTMLDNLPHRELICGFLSGKAEILCWDAADLFQLYHDTTPLRGSLSALLPQLDETAVQRAISLGACSIYHGCVHNLLYEKSEHVLKNLYKSASFVVQAICYRQTGRYIRHQNELLEVVSPEEQAIVASFLALKNGEHVDFQLFSEILFTWAQRWITNI